MDTTKALLLLALGLSLAGCGPELLVPVEPDPAEEPGVLAPDDGTGEVVAEGEADGGLDCAALDLCPDGPDETLLPDDAGVAPADAGARDAGAAVDAGSAPAHPAAGAKLLVRTWLTFRSGPSSTASALSTVDPRGGVHDSEHGAGMPLGMLPPGQVVTLVSAAPTAGFYKVKYDGQVGWLPASKLLALDPALHPTQVALLPAARNAFFKHQLHRSAWNKDGPYSSGTCAPTSLAMAARIFGREPAGLSIEQSIHRARQSYGVGTDHVGTTRYQIRQGALALGLSVAALDTRLSTASMLARLDTQLGKKRVVVLEGQPGDAGGATTYQAAFNRAYAKAGVGKSYTFDGRHSILVLGRDAGGGYLVGDPISEVGMVVLTGPELRDFMARWGGTGNAVW